MPKFVLHFPLNLLNLIYTKATSFKFYAYINHLTLWKTKDKKGSKKGMLNKNFCPFLSQMWITQGGGYQLANNEFVATNLSHKTPNFCSKNSLKNQTILKVKIYKFLLKNQSFLNVKSYKNLIKNRYFSNLTNINLDNCLLNNQVKNLSNTHFSNLKNINLYFRNIKHYIKNLIYFWHTYSGLFRIYCQRLN